MDRRRFVASQRHEIGLYWQLFVRKRDFLSLNGDRVFRNQIGSEKVMGFDANRFMDFGNIPKANKGKTYEFDSVIDLDDCLGEPGATSNFHQLLARTAGIDPYSYLYEVLEAHEIEFSDATGVAARSCHDGRFDWALFELDRREERDWQRVRAIAENTMTARELGTQPRI